jgi:hypothetical protein
MLQRNLPARRIPGGYIASQGFDFPVVIGAVIKSFVRQGTKAGLTK